MNEFVLYEIVQEGHLPSLKPQAFLSGLWEDWQVYLPLSSQSSSLLNVCRPVGFRFGLQQKSFVMMKSQFPVRFPLWRNLWCCRKRPAVFKWIWYICFVAVIVFFRCQTTLCSALMIGGASLYVKWTTPMTFRKCWCSYNIPIKIHTCGTWNPIFEVSIFSGSAEMFLSVSRRLFFLFL